MVRGFAHTEDSVKRQMIDLEHKRAWLAVVRAGTTVERDRRRARGFTLLELLVVMVILGLLVGYVAPRYFQQVGKSEVKMAQAQIDSLQKALDVYRLDTGRYPSTDQGLKALVERPKKGVPLDPWGHAYLYRYPGERNELDLVSLGKDGQPGGTGEAADITNH